MFPVKILGKEKLNKFIQDSLINGKVRFLDAIKKQSQDCNKIKKKVKKKKSVSKIDSIDLVE